ncbi:Protein of unknown function [Pyronema omphalodes CBS 100304]|uniref:Uncharacterized protein n=1 Tax=Pyronema omphalodes (strain CBS 100304) TaxID=1076935 RepID=U4KY73_PYROM|nr:Protein of unknown function [Pyronema omphalodes CBS 100304]
MDTEELQPTASHEPNKLNILAQDTQGVAGEPITPSLDTLPFEQRSPKMCDLIHRLRLYDHSDTENGQIQSIKGRIVIYCDQLEILHERKIWFLRNASEHLKMGGKEDAVVTAYEELKSQDATWNSSKYKAVLEKVESAYHERLLGLLGGKEARTLKAKSLNVSTLDVQMAQDYNAKSQDQSTTKLDEYRYHGLRYRLGSKRYCREFFSDYHAEGIQTGDEPETVLLKLYKAINADKNLQNEEEIELVLYRGRIPQALEAPSGTKLSDYDSDE